MTAALTEHAEFEASHCVVMMSPGGFVSAIVIGVFIVSICERHDNIRRVDDGVMIKILVLVVEPTLRKRTHSVGLDFLRSD